MVSLTSFHLRQQTLVDGKFLDSVMLGRDRVARIELDGSVLSVYRSEGDSVRLWFCLTDYGVGMPLTIVDEAPEPAAVDLWAAKKQRGKR